MTETTYSIDTLLEWMVGRGASDLHLTVGSQPAIRVHGHLHRLENFPALTAENSRQLLYRILNTEQQKRLEIDRQIDLSYSIPGRRPLPRERLLAAREPRGRVPHDSGLAQDARGARAADVAPRPDEQAARPRARHRPDRLGQVDDALGADRRDQPKPRRPHHHHRGPDRVPAPPQEVRRQPARDRARRHQLRRGAPRRAPPGPRRDPPGRDARPRDDLDRADRGRDRPPRLRHPAHPGRGLDDRPRHRRLPGVPAGAGPHAARRHDPGRRRAGTPADRRRPGPRGRRSRSCCRTTPSGT